MTVHRASRSRASTLRTLLQVLLASEEESRGSRRAGVEHRLGSCGSLLAFDRARIVVLCRTHRAWLLLCCGIMDDAGMWDASVLIISLLIDGRTTISQLFQRQPKASDQMPVITLLSGIHYQSRCLGPEDGIVSASTMPPGTPLWSNGREVEIPVRSRLTRSWYKVYLRTV